MKLDDFAEEELQSGRLLVWIFDKSTVEIKLKILYERLRVDIMDTRKDLVWSQSYDSYLSICSPCRFPTLRTLSIARYHRTQDFHTATYSNAKHRWARTLDA